MLELVAVATVAATVIARGHSDIDIARQLYVSDATVKTHVAHVFAKLDLHDRAQAVVYAYETGVVQPRPLARATDQP